MLNVAGAFFDKLSKKTGGFYSRLQLLSFTPEGGRLEGRIFRRTWDS